jgi:hypothetical protein
VLVLEQDRCKVCTKRAIGSEIVPQAQESFWIKQIELLGDEAQVDARFGLFGDSANLNAKQVHYLH